MAGFNLITEGDLERGNHQLHSESAFGLRIYDADRDNECNSLPATADDGRRVVSNRQRVFDARLRVAVLRRRAVEDGCVENGSELTTKLST
jgi:hypothetical protein